MTGERDGARYFFADRYAWAQFATFASHLSLILFMAGGIVSKVAGFETFVEVGEGATQPVFPVVHENQMQILNVDSIEGRDAEGNIIDYRTHAVVFQNGEERCRGELTVNGPLRCNGYTFHQAAYTANGVALQVRDRNTGQVVLAEAPVLQEQVPAPRPRLRVRDAGGAVVLDESFTMAPVSQERLAQIFAVPGHDRPFAVSGPLDTSGGAWQLDIVRVPRPGDPAGEQIRVALRRGETGQLGGYTFEFVELGGNPYEVITGIPGMERAAFIQLAQDAGGAIYVDVVNMAARNPETARFHLAPGESTVVGEYEYTFQGRREHTGVLVKRDPGSWFICTAPALLMGGLLVTFCVPRRRLWAKVTPETTYLAGLADRGARLSDELRQLGEEMRAAGNGVEWDGAEAVETDQANPSQ